MYAVCRWLGVFSRRGSNTKVGYIVPSDYLTEMKYEKNIVSATTETKDHWDSLYGQTFSVHAQHLAGQERWFFG